MEVIIRRGISQIQEFQEEAGGEKKDARGEWCAGESTGQRATSPGFKIPVLLE